MSDRDPAIGRPDWAATRAAAARGVLRRMVENVAGKTTDLAEAPLPLDKGVYIDPVRFAAEREHEAFRALLEDAGAEVIAAGPDAAGLLDAIFAYDPSLTTDAGAILLRPGKMLRLPEVELAERTYAELGIPIVGRIEEPGVVEGGDTSGWTAGRWRSAAAI